MTIDWRRHWWQPGFTAAFLIVGVPYWLIPYHELNLPDAVLGARLLVVVAAAALARIYSGRRFGQVVAVMGSTVPAVVVARPVVDVLRDSTSHNLWPFEVVMATLVGGVVATAGALLGGVVARLSR